MLTLETPPFCLTTLKKKHHEEFSEFLKSNTDHMHATVFSRIKTDSSGLHGQQHSQNANPRQSLEYKNGRHSDLTTAIINFIFEGLYPVTVVEEPTFKTLMSTVDPGYSPSTRSELAVKTGLCWRA